MLTFISSTKQSPKLTPVIFPATVRSYFCLKLAEPLATVLKHEMENNEILHLKVGAAIQKATSLGNTSIEVFVNNGIVTLSGTVENADDKEIAAAVTRAVPGVKAIIQRLDIDESPEKLLANARRKKIIEAFRKNIEIPYDRISVRVEPGRVLIGGKVKWNYQKVAAIEVASGIADGLPVIDNMVVDNNAKEELTKESVIEALKNDARTVCDEVSAIVNGRNVILVGSVPTQDQKVLAERIVADLPGVNSVTNALHIR